jgi:hypothetical protein
MPFEGFTSVSGFFGLSPGLTVVVVGAVVFGELELLGGFGGHRPDSHRPSRDSVQQILLLRAAHRAGLNQLPDDGENLLQS